MIRKSIFFFVICINNCILKAQECKIIEDLPVEVTYTTGSTFNKLLLVNGGLTFIKQLSLSEVKKDIKDGMLLVNLEKYQGTPALPKDVLERNLKVVAPYTINDEKSFAVITLSSGWKYTRTSFALVNLLTNKLISELPYTGQLSYLIDSDNGFFIALERKKKDVKEKVKDKIARKIGHGSSYYDLYISVYNFNGELNCSTLIEKELRDVRGFVRRAQ